MEEYVLSDEWKNSIKYKPARYDFAEDFMYFCILYPFIALAINNFLRPFLFFIMMILMTLNRRKSKKLINYIIFHIVILFSFLATILALSTSEKIIFITALVISSAVSFAKLKNRNNTFAGNSLVCTGIPFMYITYIAALYLQHQVVIYICFICCTIFIICFTIYKNKSCTFGVLVCSEGYSKDSLKKVKSLNLLFSFVSSIVIAFISFITYKAVYLTGIDRVDAYIIKFFSGSNMNLASQSNMNNPKVANWYKSRSGVQKAFLRNGQNKTLPKIIAYTFYVIIAIFIIIVITEFILIPIFKSLRNALRKAGNSINEEAETVFPFTDIKNEIGEEIKKIPHKLNIFSDNSNSMKVRKIYYRTIKRYKLKGIKIVNYDTPHEIKGKIEDNAKTDINILTDIYEKARYSDEECSKNDVMKAKNRPL